MRWARGVALALLSEGGQPEEEEEEESSCEQGLGPERATAAAGTPSSSYSSSTTRLETSQGLPQHPAEPKQEKALSSVVYGRVPPSLCCQTSLTWGADMFEGWDLRGRPTAGG